MLCVEFGHTLGSILDHRLNAPAAAFAAVAKGIEAVQAGIFEPGRVQMSAFVLHPQKLYRFSLSESASAVWVVLHNMKSTPGWPITIQTCVGWHGLTRA